MKKIYFLLLVCVLSLLLNACGKDPNTIYVGASPVPHAEILEVIRDDLLEQGYKLKITVYTDYVLPNMNLWSKDLDANYFQHKPYLDDFNEKNNMNLVGVLAVHFEPLSLYAGVRSSLGNTDGAKIAVPNDPSNCARALLLLDDLGLLTVDKTKGLAATKRDITDNPHNLDIVELEAASIPARLPEFDFAVINGNYALSSRIPSEKLIASEETSSTAADIYANYIVVRFDKVEDKKTKALIQALSSQKVKDFIKENYPGSVICVFDEDR